MEKEKHYLVKIAQQLCKNKTWFQEQKLILNLQRNINDMGNSQEKFLHPKIARFNKENQMQLFWLWKILNKNICKPTSWSPAVGSNSWKQSLSSNWCRLY